MLDDPRCPLSTYLAEQLPDLRSLRADYRSRLPAREVAKPQPPAGVRAAYGTLGAAIDHRLRLAMNAEPAVPATVRSGITGAERLAATPHLRETFRQIGNELSEGLTSRFERNDIDRRDRPLRLDDVEEDPLLRSLYVAALFEEVYRSRRLAPGTQLGDVTPSTTLGDLLDAVPAYAVHDLISLVSLADGGLRDVRLKTPPEHVVTGPTFRGSPDVDGADADWIAGDLLVDVKATTTPATLQREVIYQLVGYLLLDYDDDLSIGRVGWYQARLGALVAWPVDHFLRLLGGTRPVRDLRREVEDLVGG